MKTLQIKFQAIFESFYLKFASFAYNHGCLPPSFRGPIFTTDSGDLIPLVVLIGNDGGVVRRVFLMVKSFWLSDSV